MLVVNNSNDDHEFYSMKKKIRRATGPQKMETKKMQHFYLQFGETNNSKNVEDAEKGKNKVKRKMMGSIIVLQRFAVFCCFFRFFRC